MFQEALNLHREKKYTESYNIYDELFKLDVVGSHYYEEENYLRGLQNGGMNFNVDEMAYLSPTVKTLRYLVFRNRGFLYFDMLKVGEVVDEPMGEHASKKKKELFYTMIEDLCASLVYQEADEGLLEKLYELFIFLDNKRLARFTLEYYMSGKYESDDLLGLMPVDANILQNYQALLEMLNSAGDRNTDKVTLSILKKLSFLNFIKEDFKEQIVKNEKLVILRPEIQCKPSELTWSVIIESIDMQLKKSQDKNKILDVPRSKLKNLEPYWLTEMTFERVSFEFTTEIGSNEHNLDPSPISMKEDNNGINDQDISEIDIEGHQDIGEDNNEVVNILSTDVNDESTAPNSEIESVNKEGSEMNKSEIESKPNPVIQRSSKRFKPRNEGLSYDSIEYELKRVDFLETQKFFESLNEYFCALNLTREPRLDNIINKYLPNDDEPEVELYIQDYLHILNNWSPKLTSSMILSNNSPGSSSDDRMKLLDVLKTFESKGGAISNDDKVSLSDLENPDKILEFLKKINSNSLTYIDVKFEILKHLLAYNNIGNNQENSCLIERLLWEKGLFEKISDWILEFDLIILNRFNELNFSIENYSFAVSIFEILVDSYVELRHQINKSATESSRKSFGKGSKVSINSLCMEMSKLGDKLSKWVHFLDIYCSNIPDFTLERMDFFNLTCRYKWANIYREKSRNDDWLENNYVISELEELLNQVLHYKEDIHIALPNYRNINEINSKSIKSHLTTCHVLSMFAKLIYADSEMINSDAIRLLESILFEEKSPSGDLDNNVIDETTLISIKKFLDKSSIDMRLSLWNILFLYYDQDTIRYKYGFEKSLKFILSYLYSDTYTLKLTSYRNEELAKIFGYFGTIASQYVRLLKTQQWKISQNDFKSDFADNFQNILSFFELLYLFSVHEEAALLTGKKSSVKSSSSKAYDYFKDLFIEVACLMVIYYENALLLDENVINQERYSSFLSLIHDQLGLRRLCDSSKGLFLNLLQDRFFFMDINTENELAQVVMCRYHYKLNVNKFFPTDHETSYTDIVDKDSVRNLANFVLPLCFKKNPLINIPKHDLKQIIDDFYEVIGDPELEDSKILKKNSSIIDSFLDTTLIRPKLLRDSFYGLASLDLSNKVPNNLVVNGGLYYLQGLLIFSSYKIRKKNMQSRAVELENVIKLLKNDLIFSTNRLESWLLLGQAYGYSVEDDLIWTSDKLTIPERKIATANLQRKSILCYLMAINESTNHFKFSSKEYVKPVIGILMGSFSKEMYSACMQPMDMHAFKVHGYPKLIRNNKGVDLEHVSKNSYISKTLCLKIMQQSLHVAIKNNPDDWTNLYYLSKIQRKLGKCPEMVLETLKTSSLLAKEAQIGDAIIEPHYVLCSMLYKYVKNDKIGIDRAIAHLEQDPIIQYKRTEKPILEKNEFYQAIVDSLRKINSYDKKKWHHKPRYRLAKILDEEFDNSTEALEEMSSFVSLKASNKTLVLIWKPDNERPGKHFCYTYQYAQFYLEILTKQSNLTGLVQMLPKLRRSNATMVSLYNAWENLCSSICKLIRSHLDVDENFTETIMQSLTFQAFSNKSKELIDVMKNKGIPPSLEPHLCYLHAVNDMKKFNNGFGPTSLIDDTLVAIYLRIYFFFDHSANQTISVAESPSSKVKKLAKRYVFPFANDILKHFKKNIDHILKEKPNIYNDFFPKVIESNTEKEEVEKLNTSGNGQSAFRTPSPILDDTSITPLNALVLTSKDTSIANNLLTNNEPSNISVGESIAQQHLSENRLEEDISSTKASSLGTEDVDNSSIPNDQRLTVKHKIDNEDSEKLKLTKLDISKQDSDLYVDCVEHFD